MKKNHGCLWYLFVFPIQLGFYLVYYLTYYFTLVLFKFFTYVIKLLLSTCKKIWYKLLDRIRGYSDSQKYITNEIDGSLPKITSNSNTLPAVAQIEHESTIFQPPGNADPYFIAAAKYIIENNNVSVGMLQRYFKIGFNRAAHIIDQLEDVGIVSPEDGFAPRRILMNLEEFEQNLKNDSFHFSSNEHTESSVLPDTNELIALYNNQYDYMDGHDFEYFCADILRKNGFSDVEVTQGSGDHGIDITAVKDEISYAIQCKCYSSNIGNAAVQQAHTGKSIYHKDIAVVLTNKYFTQQAKEEADALSVKLWDRDKLNELIKKAN